MISMDKKYRTGDGREVIIHSVNGPNNIEPVIASVKNGHEWMVSTWCANGQARFSLGNSSDLVEVREPRTIWVNEYQEELVAHKLENTARDLAFNGAVRVAVEYREVIKEDQP